MYCFLAGGATSGISGHIILDLASYFLYHICVTICDGAKALQSSTCLNMWLVVCEGMLC